MQTKALTMGSAMALLAVLAAPGFAEVNPEDAIKYRKAVMTVQAWNLGPLAAMARGEIPFDPEVAVQSARNLDATSHMLLDGFTPGSDVGQTRARPEIWDRWADFQEKAAAFESRAADLVAAADSGDAGAFRQAVGNAGSACRACHTDYRTD